MINSDGICFHLSKLYKGATHDKAIFDRSGAVDFLTYKNTREHQSVETRKIIMGDLVYTGIKRTIPEAILPFKKPRGHQLTEDQKKIQQGTFK